MIDLVNTFRERVEKKKRRNRKERTDMGVTKSLPMMSRFKFMHIKYNSEMTVHDGNMVYN